MIEVRDLDFAYGTNGFRLQVPRLDVAEGESVALVGPSGCGKTTLLALISGILVPAAGSIKIDEINIARLGGEARRDFRAIRMGLVFQEFELLEYLSVLDNILLPYRISPILELNETVVSRARTLAENVGLADKLSRRPGHLSQGERQRVAVCRALLARPGLVLGDEPTGNLDPANRDHVMDILDTYGAESRAPLLVVTHDHELLPRFDRTLDIRELSR